MKTKLPILIVLFLMLQITLQQSAYSQLKGDKLIGGAGLDAASQAPAGTLSLLVPLYFYAANKLKNDHGNTVALQSGLNTFITGIGASYVSNLKILNGTFGATVLIPFAQNKIEGNALSSSSPFAFSDVYIQPFQLGWETKNADFTFNYGMYLPSGRYKFAEDKNSGLGMLANELSAGTTLRLDGKGTVSFAALLSYEIHSMKKDTDIKTGDILSVEGGLGKSWYTFKGKVPVSQIKGGIVYYIQCKTSPDKIPYQQSVFSPGKDEVYAWGLEASILLIKPKMLMGVRWFDEFSAVNRFQGKTLFVTLAHVFSLGGKKEAKATQ